MCENSPVGNNEEIEYPAHKKDELLNLLKNYEVKVFSKADENYEYLEDGDVVLEVQNPVNKNNLGIELTDEFSLYFSGWHAHYGPFEQDFEQMKRDICDILGGKAGAFIMTGSKGWLGSVLCREEISHLMDEKELVKRCWWHKETAKQLFAGGGRIDVIYWKPEDTYLFEVSAGNDVKRRFPRRSTVRFIMEGKRVLGSGGYKKYDDSTAYLHYLYIEPSEEYDVAEAYRDLFRVLERDMINDGYKEILVLNDETSCESFYFENGFQSVEMSYDVSRIRKLDWAEIKYTKQLIKQLS